MLASAGHSFAWEGKVVEVIDGDSIRVKNGGIVQTIRLYGIDAPEYDQSYSKDALQLMNALVSRQRVSVEEKDTDAYGRTVALVKSKGKSVNHEVVRLGLAWFYERYCREQPICGELQSLEEKAREKLTGLWQDENPVAPWDWKREQRSAAE